jgi:hypothetical protein
VLVTVLVNVLVAVLVKVPTIVPVGVGAAGLEGPLFCEQPAIKAAERSVSAIKLPMSFFTQSTPQNILDFHVEMKFRWES